MMLHLEKTLLHLRKKRAKERQYLWEVGWCSISRRIFAVRAAQETKALSITGGSPQHTAPNLFLRKKWEKCETKTGEGKLKQKELYESIWKILIKGSCCHMAVHNTPRHTFSLKKKKFVLHLRYKYENSWKLHKKGLISITGDRLHRHCTIG